MKTHIFSVCILGLLAVTLPAPAAMSEINDACRPDWTFDNAHLTCPLLQAIATGSIQGSQTVSFDFSLQPGQYSLAAWVGLEIMGLKMTVRNAATGAVLEQDDGVNGLPVCEIALQQPVDVRVSLEAGRARVSGTAGCYYFAIAQGRGCFRNTPCIARTLIDGWTEIAAEEGYSIAEWRVFDITGTDPVSLDFSLPPGSYTAIAETINAKDDIDLFVMRGSDTLLSKNEEPDNNPLCAFDIFNQASITLRFVPWTYEEGSGTRVVLLLAVKER